MGNDIGKGANRMAIAAMANVTQFEKRELLALQRKFSDLAAREGNPNTITRAEFREALEIVGVTESDTEILDRLFTMFDKTGDDQVNFREFIVGISPLITGDVVSKLNFSFELYDLDGTGQIRPNEMSFILFSMNATASYFGDPGGCCLAWIGLGLAWICVLTGWRLLFPTLTPSPTLPSPLPFSPVMTSDQIESLVDDIFKTAGENELEVWTRRCSRGCQTRH